MKDISKANISNTEIKVRFISGYEIEFEIVSAQKRIVMGVDVMGIPVLLSPTHNNENTISGLVQLNDIPDDGKYYFSLKTIYGERKCEIPISDFYINCIKTKQFNIAYNKYFKVCDNKIIGAHGKLIELKISKSDNLRLIFYYDGLILSQTEYDECRELLYKKTEYEYLAKYEKLFKNILIYIQSAIGFDKYYYNASSDETYITQEYYQLGSNVFNTIETSGLDNNKSFYIGENSEPNILSAGRTRLLIEKRENKLIPYELEKRQKLSVMIDSILSILNNYKCDDEDNRPLENGRTKSEIKEYIHSDVLKISEILLGCGYRLIDYSEAMSCGEKEQYFIPNGRTSLKYTVPALIQQNEENIVLISKGMHEGA